MKFAATLAGLCLVALPCAAATPPASPPSRLGSGYLKDAALAADFSPPPPAPGSAAQARDDEAAKAALMLRDSPRWALATADAELSVQPRQRPFPARLALRSAQPRRPGWTSCCAEPLPISGTRPARSSRAIRACAP